MYSIHYLIVLKSSEKKYMVEMGGIEPPSENLQSRSLHA